MQAGEDVLQCGATLCLTTNSQQSTCMLFFPSHRQHAHTSSVAPTPLPTFPQSSAVHHQHAPPCGCCCAGPPRCDHHQDAHEDELGALDEPHTQHHLQQRLLGGLCGTGHVSERGGEGAECKVTGRRQGVLARDVDNGQPGGEGGGVK